MGKEIMRQLRKSVIEIVDISDTSSRRLLTGCPCKQQWSTSQSTSPGSPPTSSTSHPGWFGRKYCFVFYLDVYFVILFNYSFFLQLFVNQNYFTLLNMCDIFVRTSRSVEQPWLICCLIIELCLHHLLCTITIAINWDCYIYSLSAFQYPCET